MMSRWRGLCWQDLEDLLVEVGSCLGLWLGLSVVGIFDIVVLVLVRMKTVHEKLKTKD